jgi:hypothetical protein
VFDYIERFYNGASEHPSGYVIEEKRLTCPRVFGPIIT